MVFPLTAVSGLFPNYIENNRACGPDLSPDLHPGIATGMLRIGLPGLHIVKLKDEAVSMGDVPNGEGPPQLAHPYPPP